MEFKRRERQPPFEDHPWRRSPSPNTFKDDDHDLDGDIYYSLSPNGALPMFLPPRRSPPKSAPKVITVTSSSNQASPRQNKRGEHATFQHTDHTDIHGQVHQMELPDTERERYSPNFKQAPPPSHSSSPADPPQHPSHPQPSYRLDMRFDDDEFAYTAHLILNRLHEEEKVNTGCHGDFLSIMRFLSGAGESSTQKPTSSELCEDRLAEFRFALKHRLKFISPTPRASEDSLTVLTRQVAKTVAIHGYPQPVKNTDKSEHHDVDVNTSGMNRMEIQDDEPSSTTHDTGESSTIASNELPVKFKHQSTEKASPEPRFFFPSDEFDSNRRLQDETVEEETRSPPNTTSTEYTPSPTLPTLHGRPSPAPYDHIRQQYQHQMDQQKHQFPWPQAWPYHDPHHSPYDGRSLHRRRRHHLESNGDAIFEIVDAQPAFFVPLDAYFDEPTMPEFTVEPIDFGPILSLEPAGVFEGDNMVDSNAIYVGIDRSFEEDAVVMRELKRPSPAQFPVLATDESFAEEVIVPSEPLLSPLQLSRLRQKTMAEAKGVTSMINLTSNPSVKESCRHRLPELQEELKLMSLALQNSSSSSLDALRQEVILQNNTIAEEEKESVQLEIKQANVRSEDITEIVFKRSGPDSPPRNYGLKLNHNESDGINANLHEEGVKFAKECLAEFEEANSIVTQEFSDLWAGRSLNTGLKTQTTAENTQQYIIDTSGRVGKWKDTLWNLFEFGPLHASVTLSIFFPILALGQVMTRLQSGWIALPNRARRPKDAFRLALIITMFTITINCLLYYLAEANVIRTRRRLRKRFIIPMKRQYEDLFVGGVIPMLVVSQMLRHTSDYDTYSGQFCTATGLPDHVEVKLPKVLSDSCSVSTMSEPFQL